MAFAAGGIIPILSPRLLPSDDALFDSISNTYGYSTDRSPPNDSSQDSSNSLLDELDNGSVSIPSVDCNTPEPAPVPTPLVHYHNKNNIIPDTTGNNINIFPITVTNSGNTSAEILTNGHANTVNNNINNGNNNSTSATNIRINNTVVNSGNNNNTNNSNSNNISNNTNGDNPTINPATNTTTNNVAPLTVSHTGTMYTYTPAQMRTYAQAVHNSISNNNNVTSSITSNNNQLNSSFSIAQSGINSNGATIINNNTNTISPNKTSSKRKSAGNQLLSTSNMNSTVNKVSNNSMAPIPSATVSEPDINIDVQQQQQRDQQQQQQQQLPQSGRLHNMTPEEKIFYYRLVEQIAPTTVPQWKEAGRLFSIAYPTQKERDWRTLQRCWKSAFKSTLPKYQPSGEHIRSAETITLLEADQAINEKGQIKTVGFPGYGKNKISIPTSSTVNYQPNSNSNSNNNNSSNSNQSNKRNRSSTQYHSTAVAINTADADADLDAAGNIIEPNNNTSQSIPIAIQSPIDIVPVSQRLFNQPYDSNSNADAKPPTMNVLFNHLIKQTDKAIDSNKELVIQLHNNSQSNLQQLVVAMQSQTNQILAAIIATNNNNNNNNPLNPN